MDMLMWDCSLWDACYSVDSVGSLVHWFIELTIRYIALRSAEADAKHESIRELARIYTNK